MAETTTEAITPTSAFDTLAWSDMLQSGGIPRKQAEVHAKVFAQAMGQGVATKDDLRHTEMRLTNEIQKIRTLISDQRSELLKWMFTMLMAQAGLVITIIKFL